MLTRLRRADPADDAGITLAELIVATTISMILLIMSTTFMISATRSTDTTASTNQQVGAARNALDSWTSLLRVSAWLDSARTDRFEEVTPTKIVFYANLDNRDTPDFAVGTPSKVVLMLDSPDARTGAGQLVEIVFPGGSTVPSTVRRVALDAGPIGGALFTPYNYTGAEMNPASYEGCKSGGAAVEGLCLQSPPAGHGLLDPTVASDSLSVSAGSLTGNPHQDVDTELQSIAAVKVAFTVSNTAGTASEDYQSLVAVNSGFNQ